MAKTKSKSTSKLAVTTLVGWISGIVFIYFALMESHRPELFVNMPSLYMIVGGTAACLFTVYPFERLKLFFPTCIRAFKTNPVNMRQDIETIVELAKEARSKGIIALEGSIDQFPMDKFMKEGILLIADGISEEEFRNHMESIMHFTKVRHNKNAGMVELIASVAPSLGLVGTYVGLIPMLTNLDDPTSLGPMMAIELVSSFYGGLLSNILFGPIAKRLKMLSEEEHSRNELILEGLISIQQGKNPRMIESELMAFMNLQVDAKDNSINFGGKKQKNKSKVA